MITAGVSPNIGSFLGGGTLRSVGKGMAMGKATADGTPRPHARRHGRGHGGWRVRRLHALIYPPDAYVDTDELVEICKVVRAAASITHLRSEVSSLWRRWRRPLTSAGAPMWR